MSTNLLQKTISRAFPGDFATKAAEFIFLLSVGMVAVILHSKLRMPMHLPGKQGVLFMMLVVSARGMSRWPFGASISCAGAAMLLLMPGPGFHDPFMAVNYILAGCMMDTVFTFMTKQTSKTWLIAGVTGLCWVLVPLIRLTISCFFTMPMGAFSNGWVYPVITHLAFGLAGGLAAAGILTLAQKNS